MKNKSYKEMKKAELEKARVDEGLSPHQKQDVRTQRNRRTTQPVLMGKLPKNSGVPFDDRPETGEQAQAIAVAQHHKQVMKENPLVQQGNPFPSSLHQQAEMEKRYAEANAKGAAVSRLQSQRTIKPKLDKSLTPGESYNDLFKSASFEAPAADEGDLRKSEGQMAGEDDSDPTCVMDFHGETNKKIDDDVIRKLGQVQKSESLEKGKNPEGYRNAGVDLRTMGKLAGPRTEPEGKQKKFFTPEESNAKTAKNAHVGGYLSGIVHLAPAGLAGRGNVCPGLSKGCKQSCLNTAGHGGMGVGSGDQKTNMVQDARISRTQHILDHPHHALEQIDKEITSLKTRAHKEGKKAVVRLNGTSDLAWEHYRHPAWGGANLMQRHPDVQFHDYTARPERMRDNREPNYHLTFSHKEDNHDTAMQMLKEGHNVTVAFGYGSNKFGVQGNKRKAMKARGEEPGIDYDKFPLPKKHFGHNVIEGDSHDLRFLDDKGSKEHGGNIVGLRAKGDGIHDTSGFVQWGHEGAPTAKPRPFKEGQGFKEKLIGQANAAKKPKAGGEEGGTPLAASELKPGMSYNDMKLNKALPQVNPELVSNKPTHTYKGVKVKVFTDRNGPSFNYHTGQQMHIAEIMEGDSKGKWTSVERDELKPL